MAQEDNYKKEGHAVLKIHSKKLFLRNERKIENLDICCFTARALPQRLLRPFDKLMDQEDNYKREGHTLLEIRG